MRHWGSFNVSESFQIVCRSSSDTWGGQIKEYDEKTGRWMRHNNQYVSQLNRLIIRWILALMRADTHIHVLLYLLLHLTPHTSRKAQVCSKLSPLLETTCCAQILSRPRWWLLCRPDEKSSTKPMNSEERRRLFADWVANRWSKIFTWWSSCPARFSRLQTLDRCSQRNNRMTGDKILVNGM